MKPGADFHAAPGLAFFAAPSAPTFRVISFALFFLLMPHVFLRSMFLVAVLAVAAPVSAAPIRKQERSQETTERLALRKKPAPDVVLAPYQGGWTPLDLCDPRLGQWIEDTFHFGPIAACRQEEVHLDSFGTWGKIIFFTAGPEGRRSERLVLARGAEYRIADELKEPLKVLDAYFERWVRKLLKRSRKGSESAPAEDALFAIMRGSKRLAVFDRESELCLRYDLVPPVIGNLRFCVGDDAPTGRARLSPDIGVYAFEVKQVEQYIAKAGLSVDLNSALVSPKWTRASGWYYAFLLRDQSPEGDGRRIGIRAFRSGRTEHFILPTPSAGEPENSLFDLF